MARSLVRAISGTNPCGFAAWPQYSLWWKSRIAQGDEAVPPSVGTMIQEAATHGWYPVVSASERDHVALGTGLAGSCDHAASSAVLPSPVAQFAWALGGELLGGAEVLTGGVLVIDGCAPPCVGGTYGAPEDEDGMAGVGWLQAAIPSTGQHDAHHSSE